jgi:ParB family chromosome partitioning protein
MSRKALGRGLGALIPEAPVVPESAPAPDAGGGLKEIPVDRIRSNPYQPRTVFSPEALEELSASILENGLIQPLVVRQTPDGFFELIAGERRYLASRKAGLETVPAVVRTASRREMLEMALVENLQREDLGPLEEAEAFHRLATEFGLTQEEIARRVSRSRTAVTNALRLLSLEPEFRELLAREQITAGHARALLALPPGENRRKLAKEIQEKGLSVRQAEARVQGAQPRPRKAVARKRSHQALEAWEDRLRNRFGTQVRIVGGVGRGRVELHYFNEEDLERILELAGVASDL